MFSNYSSHASGSSQPPQSHGQPFVTIRHPEYPIENSVLFRLPKLDITIGRDQDSDSDFVGVHHGTVLTACRILVGNDKTAYLSYDQSGKSPVSLDFEGVLCRSEYYLQVKQGEPSVTLICWIILLISCDTQESMERGRTSSSLTLNTGDFLLMGYQSPGHMKAFSSTKQRSQRLVASFLTLQPRVEPISFHKALVHGFEGTRCDDI